MQARLRRGSSTRGFWAPEEIETLNHRNGSYQDYYKSPDEATKRANVIIDYMAKVKLLHDDAAKQLDLVNKVRCILFIPVRNPFTDRLDFLDPAVSE